MNSVKVLVLSTFRIFRPKTVVLFNKTLDSLSERNLRRAVACVENWTNVFNMQAN